MIECVTNAKNVYDEYECEDEKHVVLKMQIV